MSHFDRAVLDVLKHEGGYVRNPQDPGGETNFGISKRVYPREDIKGMTKARAIAIYRRDYWHPKYDLMPYQVAAKVFDMAVNMGAKQAHKLLQRAAGVVDDGVIGNKTVQAVNAFSVGALLDNITIEQNKYYAAVVRNRPTSSIFMAGWTHRAAWHPTA